MPTAKDVIRTTLDSADMVLGAYIGDLTDEELLVPPGEGMNPIAWQVGHLIASEKMMVDQLRPGASPALPAGFAEAHDKTTAAPNAFKPFCSKDEYLRLAKAQREATLAALDAVTDAQLDAETGVSYAPTGAAMMNMVGVHILMHVGQFVTVRRKLGKPVVI
ncbi:MAG: DinB family protein [Isosphaeraceae bacterium]